MQVVTGSPSRLARGAVVLAVMVAALVSASVASAATYTVGTPSDTAPSTPCATFPSNCSLRQLIEYENGAGTNDTIIVPAGSYTVNPALVINSSLSIQGAGARTTSVQATGSDRVFFIQPPNAASVPTVTLSGLTIEQGIATASNGSFGGNILNQGTLTLSEDWITAGSAQSGGGLSNMGGTLTLTHSLVSGNAANSGGADSGGIQNFGPNPVTGGAGTLEVDNSTISNNSSNLGGGIFSWCSGANNSCSNGTATNTTTIVNSTIAFNNGGGRSTNGGGLLVGEGTMSVENSIVASNTVTSGASNCGGTGITSLGNNLESGADCGFTSSGDLQNTDPQFGSGTPQNNGGNTDMFDLAFVSGAVDHIPAGAADCGGHDQRGVVRPQGVACDIGAFEFVQPAEGAQFSGTLVIAGCAVSSASVDWGDGTSSTPTIPPRGQSGPISASHTYAEEGTYTVTVNYTDDCGPHSPSFKLTVPDATLTSAGTSVTAQAGTAFTGTVATFTDADPGGTASDYSATINWGDGSSSAGTVSSASGGFQVVSTHTYAAGGSYATTVSITDAGGASTIAHGTATVNAAPSPVITGAPSVSITGAGFTGSVNPDGLPTTASFQYGLDPKYTGGGPITYTQSTPAQSVGSDFGTHTVSASVTGLVPNALYHVRLVATNSAGTSFGPDVPFTTLKAPNPSAPTVGKTFNLSPVSGVVLILVNGQLVPLTQLQQLPKNTLIDALNGTLKLTTAVPGGTGGAHDAAAKGKKRKKPKTQSGTFGGAIFKISQTRNGLATLSLVEGAIPGGPSFGTCKAHKSADATIAASKTLQLLHASAKGRFSTRGRYSAATVRGTKWTVADRCDGTLTHDITHSVAVTDFVRHKTIILHAGQSYLAKARKRK